MLREKSAAALDIVFKANNILNNKLNKAYKTSVGEMCRRHELEAKDLSEFLEREVSKVNFPSLNYPTEAVNKSFRTG